MKPFRVLSALAAILHAASVTASPIEDLHDACRFADWKSYQAAIAAFDGPIDEAPLPQHGYTALHWAASAPGDLEAGKIQIVRDLMARGADPNALTHRNDTPLKCALRGHWTPGLLTALIEGGADVNQPARTGPRPLAYAANLGDLDAVTFLIDHGAIAELRDIAYAIGGEKPWPAEHNPRERERAVQIIQMLLDARQPADIPVDTLFFSAAMTNDPKLIALIASLSEAPENATNANGLNALQHLARNSRKCSVQTVKMLRQFGFDLDAANDEGHTPLHLAVIGQNSEAVDALLQAGADPTIRDKKGLLAAETPGWGSLRKSTQKMLKAYSQEPRPTPPSDPAFPTTREARSSKPTFAPMRRFAHAHSQRSPLDSRSVFPTSMPTATSSRSVPRSNP